MQKLPFIIVLSVLAFVSGIACAHAAGLSTYFAEVKLENLAPGKTYSVKKETGDLLDVRNTTESLTVDIVIEPEKPVGHSLVPGYEPIPDLSWIKIEKSHFEKVGPGDSVESDILLSIPDKKEYCGKKYQAYIYSHTTGKATFRIGLMSRLLLHIK